MTEKKLICSQFDRLAINLLKQIVPDQKMKLEDGEGGIWTSHATDAEGIAVTIIERNHKTVARIVYDVETGIEHEFIY